MFVSMIIPDLFMGKEPKISAKRASQLVLFSKKMDKILALSTHMVIMPFSIIYSIFLPLKIGTAWFYIGLVIFILALALPVLRGLSYFVLFCE